MVRSGAEALLFEESTNQAIRDALPDAGVRFFELVTHLGDGATLVALGILLYWFGGADRRRDRAVLVAIGLGTLAIVAGIKGVVAAPRPDSAVLAFAPESYGGYSFPSAHAMGAAAVYGSLAALTNVGTKRLRYAVAGTIIVLVALSRVVIGVHYLGDVVVGVAVGLAFVAVVLREPEPEPGAIFTFSGLVAIVALVLGSTEYVTLTVGAAVGATFAWSYVSRRRASPYGASILVLGVLVLPLLFVAGGIEGVVTVHWSTEIVSYAVVTAAALLVPNVAEHLDDWTIVRRLQERLPFVGRTVDPDQLRMADD